MKAQNLSGVLFMLHQARGWQIGYKLDADKSIF